MTLNPDVPESDRPVVTTTPTEWLTSDDVPAVPAEVPPPRAETATQQ